MPSPSGPGGKLTVIPPPIGYRPPGQSTSSRVSWSGAAILNCFETSLTLRGGPGLPGTTLGPPRPCKRMVP